jgi:thymidylate synthase (FAD)
VRIVAQSVELLAYTQLPPGRISDPCSDMARVVERCGRVSWKSEDKIGPGTADSFCVRVVSIRKDYSISEHASATILFVTDRFVTHQLVRHRLGAMTQESSHYINWSKEKWGREITVIKPLSLEEGTEHYDVWYKACLAGEKAYMSLIDSGVRHHQARAVLPGCLKSEIALTYNLRMWRTIFEQRCSPNNTLETIQVCTMAASIMADLCPEIMGEWKQNAGSPFS